MIIRIPSMLQSYTDGAKNVTIEFDGKKSLLDILQQLDKKYKGIMFRFINEQQEIRQHMKIFLNKNEIIDLNERVTSNDKLFITQALSGGSK